MLATPQGEFSVGEDALLRFNQRWFISGGFLIERLKFELEFDSSAYALRVYLPWSQTTTAAATAENAATHP